MFKLQLSMIFLLKSICINASFLYDWKSYSIEKMSIEDKVAQLLIVHFNGENANHDAQILIQDIKVGGIIYYNWSNGLTSPEQVFNLSSKLQALAQQNPLAIPLLIATDQEGGLVTRLNKGFTIFPGNYALGMTGDPILAQKCAHAMGEEMGAVGINFNLSPVVDINTNPRNPIIGIRSFGNSPQTVIEYAKNAIKGYHNANTIISLKHFPGHGDVEIDSHQDLPIIHKSKEALQVHEWLPFIQLAKQADTIMTAHIMLPLIDPIYCATLSKSILDILREEIGFKGVIITDSLVMEGIIKNCLSIDDAAVCALNAGCDLLLLGGKQLLENQKGLELSVSDIKRIHQHLVKAVQTEKICKKRLNQAVKRVLNLKKKYNLAACTSLVNHQKPNKETSQDSRPVQEASIKNQWLAQLVANKALLCTNNLENRALNKKTSHNKPISYKIQQHHVAIFAPTLVKDSIDQTDLLQLGKTTQPLFFSELNPTLEEIHAALILAQMSDTLIFCSYNAWKNPGQRALLQLLTNTNKLLILIPLRDPLDATSFQADLILTTFSPTPPAIQAASQYLYNLSMHDTHLKGYASPDHR